MWRMFYLSVWMFTVLSVSVSYCAHGYRAFALGAFLRDLRLRLEFFISDFCLEELLSLFLVKNEFRWCTFLRKGATDGFYSALKSIR